MKDDTVTAWMELGVAILIGLSMLAIGIYMISLLAGCEWVQG